MRTMNKLTARKVATVKAPGYYGDGEGLTLQVSQSGTKSWLYRFTLKGKAREMGLGPWPAVPLADQFVNEKNAAGEVVPVRVSKGARTLAAEARAMVKQEKRDPIEHRRLTMASTAPAVKKAVTFRECAEAYIESKRHEWKNDKHAAQWTSTLETYAYPHMSITKAKKGEPAPGDMSVAEVTKEHVLAALKPIWTTKTETASRLRSRIELVLSYAMQAEHRTEGANPARWRGGLDALLPKPGKVAKVEHHKALDVNAVAGFISLLRAKTGMGARGLEFVALTACRSGEARGATWSEFDLQAAVWTVPGERMKMGEEQRVPLSKQAVKLLKALPKMAGSEYVFPAPRGGMLSDMTLSAVMRSMNLDAVPHGLRSTFRDWAGEHTEFPRELVEHALAHRIGNQAEQAYRRGDALERRRPLMQAWADHCDQPVRPASVVPIGKAKRRVAK